MSKLQNRIPTFSKCVAVKACESLRLGDYALPHPSLTAPRMSICTNMQTKKLQHQVEIQIPHGINRFWCFMTGPSGVQTACLNEQIKSYAGPGAYIPITSNNMFTLKRYTQVQDRLFVFPCFFPTSVSNMLAKYTPYYIGMHSLLWYSYCNCMHTSMHKWALHSPTVPIQSLKCHAAHVHQPAIWAQRCNDEMICINGRSMPLLSGFP